MADWKTLARCAGTALLVILLAMYWETAVSWALYIFNGLWPVLLSLVLAYVADIPLQFLERGYRRIGRGRLPDGLRRPLCMAAAALIVLSSLVLILLVVVPELVIAVTTLQRNLPGIIGRLHRWILTLPFGERVDLVFPNLFDGAVSQVSELDSEALFSGLFTGGAAPAVGNVLAAASSIASTLASVGVAVMLAFTWLLEKERVARQARRVLAAYRGTERLRRLAHAAHVADRSFHQYIVGQFLGAAFQGGLCALGMVVLRLPYAAGVGVLVGVTALIPVVGPLAGMVLGALMTLAGSWLSVFVFLAVIAVVQWLWQAVLYPRFVRTSVGLPGMWILVAVTVGGIFGIVGMTVAVPLAATIYQLLRERVDAFERAQAAEASRQDAEAADQEG